MLTDFSFWYSSYILFTGSKSQLCCFPSLLIKAKIKFYAVKWVEHAFNSWLGFISTWSVIIQFEGNYLKNKADCSFLFHLLIISSYIDGNTTRSKPKNKGDNTTQGSEINFSTLWFLASPGTLKDYTLHPCYETITSIEC